MKKMLTALIFISCSTTHADVPYRKQDGDSGWACNDTVAYIYAMHQNNIVGGIPDVIAGEPLGWWEQTVFRFYLENKLLTKSNFEFAKKVQSKELYTKLLEQFHQGRIEEFKTTYVLASRACQKAMDKVNDRYAEEKIKRLEAEKKNSNRQ